MEVDQQDDIPDAVAFLNSVKSVYPHYESLLTTNQLKYLDWNTR